jgi:putative peptide zinc metalloprotease protein
MAERPTFSPFWHRVRAMTPRLRPHVQITRQLYRSRIWHVVHDPATNQFYRLNPIAHEFVGMLDGRRTVEEVWKISLERHGDSAPTQNEVLQLLSQLYNSNLLAMDATPEVEQLLSRGRERRKKFIQQQAAGIMYFKLRIFNPDRYLSWLEPMLRPLLNVWGLLAWAIWIAIGLVAVLPHWEELRGGFDNAIAPANWGWLTVVFVIVKLIHETGHGVICKRFGGQVPEFGVMLLVLVPSPFVDASAAWGMSSKWQRMAIGAGGMIFELAVASLAGLLWVETLGGGSTLLHQLAYNAMLTASVSTVLFNANPLMRFDGYYILSDLLEVPNLMQRGMKMITYMFQKHMYRMKDATPPSSVPGEQAILLVYGLSALAYRVFLFFSITLWLMGKMFGLGVILALWTAVTWFAVPLGKFAHWLATSSPLAEFRARAVLTSLVAIALGLALVGAVPMPDHRRGVGVVESEARSGIFFGTDGFVEQVHVRPGQAVKAGDPIVTLRNEELQTHLVVARAELAEAEAFERLATSHEPAAAQVAREKIDAQYELIAWIQDQIGKLVVRAPHDGIVTGTDPAQMLGGHAKRGRMVCEVVDLAKLRVAATLTQTEANWLMALGPGEYSVEMRPLADVDRVVQGVATHPVPAAQQRLPHASMGYSGGGTVENDQRDKQGLMAKRPQWIAYVSLAQSPPPGTPGEPQNPPVTLLPGERVSLRFTLPRQPLLWQWLDRLQKLMQGRVNV